MYSVDFSYLDSKLDGIWDEVLSGSRFIQSIRAGTVTIPLFALYMLETYQYTKHNARNQALVGVRATGVPHKYTSYCFKHAREETGHEDMALKDVRALGFPVPAPDALRALPATETLIAYLYWISFQGNPIQRLGYSFWAERSYEYINPLIHDLRKALSLQEKQLSFFIAHAGVDEKHAAEVKEMISSCCKDSDDFYDICRVMETSLRLTGQVLVDVHAEYERLCRGEGGQYAFLLEQAGSRTVGA
jgi:pyrroloquinoline quinone (PQQ) biosynthesis protein C